MVKILDGGVFYHNGGIAQANDVTKSVIGNPDELSLIHI